MGFSSWADPQAFAEGDGVEAVHPFPDPVFILQRFYLEGKISTQVAAQSGTGQIGVDIEWPRTTVAYDQIAARFFSVREQAALAERPEIERRAAFYNIWTRKEAYLKARGDGISAGLDTFCVSSDAEARLLHSDAGATELVRWKMMALTPAPGYVAALCAVGDWRLNCYAWSD